MTTVEAGQNERQPSRRVSLLLGIGVFLLPIVFVWFLLRTGYSTVARVVGFIWLVVSLIVGFSVAGQGSAPVTSVATTPTVETSPTDAGTEPRRVNPRGPVVTAAEYAQLETGMSYDDAVGVIGAPGEELSSNELAGTRTVMYMWQNRNGTNMNAMFQNDSLVQKSQFGLE